MTGQDRSRFAGLATYLINLDGSTARLRSARSQLDAAGLAFERVPAVDGRNRATASFRGYDAARALTWFGREMTGGELGCFASHLACLERFLASDARHGLVLEDDLRLSPGFPDLLGDLLADLDGGALPGWAMINLGRPVRRLYTALPDGAGKSAAHGLCRAHYFPDTTTAILWSRAGAERFLATGREMIGPIDHVLRDWNNREDGGYGFLAAPVSTIGAESEIDGGRDARRLERGAVYHLRKHRRLLAKKCVAAVNMWRFRTGLA